MTALTATVEATDMAKKTPPPGDEAIGPILAANLARLGYTDTTIRTAEIARLVREKTGKPMSRQRISAILNAVRVSDEVIETLAKAIGVKTSEMTRRPSPKGGKTGKSSP